MLSDLKQFFSNFDEYSNIQIPSIDTFYDSENEAISLLSQVIPLIIDDDIANDLTMNIKDYATDITDGFYCLEMITIIDHWCDVLNTLCDRSTLNVIIKMILLTIFDNEEFYFINTTDQLFNYFNKNAMCFKVETVYQKIDKFATYWISKETGYLDFETLVECEDDIYAGDDYTRFILDCIRIKDKSKARRLRKLYCKNSKVKELFDEMGYGMLNGDFQFLGWINTSEYDPYYFSTSVDTVLDGIKELQKAFNIKVVRDTSWLSEVLDEISSSTYHKNYHITKLISEITEIHNTSKEIIL